MKYVILHTVCQGVERVFPIMFPELLTHSIVAENMQRAVRKETKMHAMVYGAGFCEVGSAGIVADSGSESLNIKKGYEASCRDERFLNMPNCMQGIVL